MFGSETYIGGIHVIKHLGVGDGQGGLACCSPWGHKKLDTTERLNWTEMSDWTELKHLFVFLLLICLLSQGSLSAKPRMVEGTLFFLSYSSYSWGSLTGKVKEVFQSAGSVCILIWVLLYGCTHMWTFIDPTLVTFALYHIQVYLNF